ncbi:mitochondrial ATP synthase gamma subunit-like protein [Metarhizium robertsii]|uniref:DUF7580 domain-containing protein n=2 Tax=Metarhizium robertsii TaxID=568076 RepID=E9EXL2_METRA|nr:uncharacterized protein MAA_04761 [Metarhizium robertsii ARSEF 23]EFY99832.1 hypothetical protein MAA_04761 [Metarhizium robertsii ARSEF 23]EXV06523.1 mitochondrial ATP synthase gamma subunit-like protein [Metarhizium robertsii]
MSGFEVVGVLLGTIPLVISAVKHYERVARTIQILRRRAKVMHALARSLRTEQRILENTCETLLGGVVPADCVKPLLAEPFGPLWRDDKISLEVERRLDYTTEDFKDLVENIKEALQELRVKLDLGSDMEVKEGSVVGKRALLKIAAIAVNVSQHEDAVNKIADANRKLEMLLAGNLRNETLQRRTFEGKLSGLLKIVTWSIYNALRPSLPCSCAQSHNVHLGLPVLPLICIDQDVEKTVRKLDFHVTFANEPQRFRDQSHTTWAWEEAGNQREGKLIRPEDNLAEFPQLSNLCESFSMKPQSAIYGYIADASANPPSKFGVYYPTSSDNSDTCLTVSLSSLLDQSPGPPPLSWRHRIAAVVAASLPHLHGTPWIPPKLASKDVYFIRRHGKADYEQVFVTTKPENSSAVYDDGWDDSASYDSNPSLHALGVLLMEVMLWKSIYDFWDDVKSKYSHTPALVFLNIRSDNGFSCTSSVLERIGFSGGQTYRDAVEHCIKCDLRCDFESLDNEEFRDAVYHYVVAPLQDTARIATVPMISGKVRFACTA